MKKLYKFYWDCGRQGDVTGMFIAEENEVKEATGQEIYFGEILGKHSEVYGTLEEGEITEVAVSETTVKEMEEVIGLTISGYNPLNYVNFECIRCKDSMNVQDADFYIGENGEKICEDCATKEEKKTLTKY